MGDLTVADLGEDALLARVFPLLPRGDATLLGPGDDAAVVAARESVVVTTDVLVEEQHFRLPWSAGADVGARAAAQNLADVVAMGARPTALVVALVMPGGLAVDWVLDLARGLARACAPHGVGVVGGDLSAGDRVAVSVTALGALDGRAPVRRDGAGPGDVVAHAGVCGRSAAGYAALVAGIGERHPELVAAYRVPEPPLAAGVVAAEAGATAMLDVSDGLLRDAGRLARASGVVLDLADPAAWPGDDLAVLDRVAADLGVSAREWMLTGGEDHGLLATFPGTVPPPFRVIGRVRDDQEPGVRVDGATLETSPGWDHFSRGGSAPR